MVTVEIKDEFGFLKSFEKICEKYKIVPSLRWKMVNPQMFSVELIGEGPASNLTNGCRVSGRNSFILANGEGDCLCEALEKVIEEIKAVVDWIEDEVVVETSFSHQNLIDLFGKKNEGNFY